MSFLRFLMVLSLVVWMGGLIFFSFVLAPTVFAVLPTRHLAGNVVSRSLAALHWMGIISGLVFLASSVIYSRLTVGTSNLFAAKNVLLVVMLELTAISQFAITPKMAILRSSMGEIDAVPLDNQARLQFDALHVWSTRVDGGVFFVGLLVVYLTAQALKA